MLDDLASQFKKYLEEKGGVERKNDVEVVHSVGTSINEDVNVDLMVVDDMLDDLASQFKKYLEEKGGVERKNEVERYLSDNFEDPNDFKLNILGW
jgi:hypothetical protein